LAKLLYLGEVPLAHVPSAERRDWRSLIEYRQQLIASRTAAKNRLRALLRRNGTQGPRALWTQQGLKHLSGVTLPECEGVQRELLLEVLQSSTEQVRRVGQILGRVGRLQPAVGLLTTIPGVGIRTAEAVVAYIDDAGRFRRNKSVGCYFGLVPCEDTSVKARFGHITKEGPATVRKLLVEATWQAIRRDATLRGYYERIRRNDPNRTKIAVVATAHHLLRVMHAMLRTGEVWRSTAA
jgi:transposase